MAEVFVTLVGMLYMLWIGYMGGSIRGYSRGWEAAKSLFRPKGDSE